MPLINDLMFMFSDYRKLPTVPLSLVTVNESSTLSLNCSEGLPATGVKYIWLKYDSSGSTVEITKSAVVLIPSANRSDAGIYICNITASIGSQIHKTVAVFVQCKYILLLRSLVFSDVLHINI